MDEKIRSIDERIDDTLDQLRKITDDLMRMQGELDALKKEEQAKEWLKVGDVYMFIRDFGEVHSSTFDADRVDNGRQSIGNFFRTREEAEERAALLRWLAEDPARWRKIQVWREICEFADGGEYILCASRESEIIPCSDDSLWKYGLPTFSSSNNAHECIDKIGIDRLKRDWFGVEV